MKHEITTEINQKIQSLQDQYKNQLERKKQFEILLEEKDVKILNVYRKMT